MKIINSKTNQEIKDLVRLKKNNNKQEKENIFIFEGDNFLDYKKEIDKHLLKVYTTNKNKIFKNQIIVSNEVFKKISFLNKERGYFFICKRFNSKKQKNTNSIFLNNIQDPGNVGSLIRSALAFNFKNIYFDEQTANPFSEKVIRASQGSFFKINLLKIKDISEIKKEKFKIITTDLNGKNYKEIDNINFTNNNICLVLGNEGNGIFKKYIKNSDLNVKIPINPEIESLNVAIAGSILMSEFKK